MAKRRRRMAKSPRRPRADWVYRDNSYTPAGAFADALGTYTQQESLVAAGPAAAVGLILYDSKSYMSHTTQTTTGLAIPFSSAARAEGGNAKVVACEGTVLIRPNTWALGSELLAGFRFGVFEQSPDTGNIQVDVSYSMWDERLDVALNPAVWANRPFTKERRFFQRFATANDASGWQLNFRFPVNRTLKSNQAFALYIEGSTALGGFGASVTFFVQPWLRTLVIDEG